MKILKHIPLKDILVVGVPSLLLIAFLYSLKSSFPDVVNFMGTLIVFVVTPAVIALLTLERGAFMFISGAFVTQALTASLVYLVSNRTFTDALGLGACAIVIYVVALSQYSGTISLPKTEKEV